MTISDPIVRLASKYIFYYSPGTCSLAPHIEGYTIVDAYLLVFYYWGRWRIRLDMGAHYPLGRG
jgi:hypothetical protein